MSSLKKLNSHTFCIN